MMFVSICYSLPLGELEDKNRHLEAQVSELILKNQELKQQLSLKYEEIKKLKTR